MTYYFLAMSVCIAIAILFLGYSSLYQWEVKKAEKELAVVLPGFLKKLLKTTVIFSLSLTVFLGILLVFVRV